MKRIGNLYPKIAELDNLKLAYWKAKKGKSSKKEVIDFGHNLESNLTLLQKELLSYHVPMGDYHYFTIHDPKERVICAASFRERVLQHAIMNVCEPIFERYQIFDSFACRKNKGVDACLERTKYFCQKNTWFLKLDIHKYFDSIDHKILLNLLNCRFKDPYLLNLFSNLLDTYEVKEGKGIPIGNLTSQYFANLYLGLLDHQIKDVWHIKSYVRYMDDFILFSKERLDLKNWEREIKTFLIEKLELTMNKSISNKTQQGIPFLSYKILGNKLRLSLKAKIRFKKKVTIAIEERSAMKVLPLLAFINRADSFNFRKKTFSDMLLMARIV